MGNGVREQTVLFPDFLIGLAIAVLRVIAVLRAAGRIDVVMHDKMRRGHVAARSLARKGPVQFVDQLPALEIEGLGDRRDGLLIVPRSSDRMSEI